MRCLGIYKAGLIVLGSAWVMAASNAAAVGVPGPQAPDVFSGDFGIMLAKNHADGESVLDDIEGIAGPGFPWDGGFDFPATLPSPPANRPPERGLGGSDAAGLADSAGRPVPEPTTGILTALGLAALAISRRPRAA